MSLAMRLSYGIKGTMGNARLEAKNRDLKIE